MKAYDEFSNINHALSNYVTFYILMAQVKEV